MRTGLHLAGGPLEQGDQHEADGDRRDDRPRGGDEGLGICLERGESGRGFGRQCGVSLDGNHGASGQSDSSGTANHRALVGGLLHFHFYISS